jgi:hypothetical protein
MLLEFARTVARIEQAEKHTVSLATDELATVAMALQQTVEWPRHELREADFSTPDNPRRAQLLLEKLKPVLATKGKYEDK